MKTKGISIWEQHIERLVLALAVLVFIGFTVMQFVGDPNSTEVGSTKFTPSNVDEKLQSEAERIRMHFERGAAPSIEIDPDALPQVSEGFRDRLVSSISPTKLLAQVQPNRPIDGGGVAVAIGKPFAIPTLPAPTMPIAQQYFDAVSPTVIEQFADLETVVMAETGDIDWMTAAAVFDLGAVMKAFRYEGPDGTPAPIPPSWYNERISILDVLIDREELVDGQWTSFTTIEPAPGQFTMRERIGNTLDAPSAQLIEEEVNDDSIRAQITQPEFYETRNASWSPPDPRVADDEPDSLEAEGEEDEQAALIRSLRKQLVTKGKRRAEVDKKLEEFGGALDDPTKPRPPAGRGDDTGGNKREGRKAPGGGGTLGSGGAPGRRGGAEEKDKANEQIRMRLTRQLRTLDDQVSRLQRRLEDVAGTQDVPEEVVAKAADDGLGEVLIWGHDLSAEPGRSYRYRLRVAIYNPFFAKKPHLIEAQHHLAEAISLTSEPSEWSEPVEVQPPLRVFITRAHAIGQRAAGDLGLGAAIAEVYRFHDGRWWQERFLVQPGDRIGAVRQSRNRAEEGEDGTIDYSTEWFLLDVVAHMNPSPREVGDGRGAWTLLQNLRTGALSPARDPRVETRMAERLQLKEQVDLAES